MREWTKGGEERAARPASLAKLHVKRLDCATATAVQSIRGCEGQNDELIGSDIDEKGGDWPKKMGHPRGQRGWWKKKEGR